MKEEEELEEIIYGISPDYNGGVEYSKGKWGRSRPWLDEEDAEELKKDIKKLYGKIV